MDEKIDVSVNEKNGKTKQKSSFWDIEAIEREEKKKQKFAHGINFYKLFWVFLVGSFLGVIIEVIWCIIMNHHYESRVGLIYGPFNLVYGFGALAVAAGLYPLRKKRDIIIFLGGFVIGSLVEYVCSVVQELMFGSVSWDYSALPYNLAGRINLLYSLFWGFLAILWVRVVYPLFSRMLIKMPDKVGKILTYILLVFMIFNTVMSALAVERWEMRITDEAQDTNIVWEYFDEHYPNERMSKIYPNMRFRETFGSNK